MPIWREIKEKHGKQGDWFAETSTNRSCMGQDGPGRLFSTWTVHQAKIDEHKASGRSPEKERPQNDVIYGTQEDGGKIGFAPSRYEESSCDDLFDDTERSTSTKRICTTNFWYILASRDYVGSTPLRTWLRWVTNIRDGKNEAVLNSKFRGECDRLYLILARSSD